MAPAPESLRLAQGCGYLPRSADAHPEFGIPLEASVVPTVCPGYSTSLPEVDEVRRYRPSYMKGYLASRLPDCSQAMFDAQDILEGAVNTWQAYDTERRRKEAKDANG
jgi:hypothetical protein